MKKSYLMTEGLANLLTFKAIFTLILLGTTIQSGFSGNTISPGTKVKVMQGTSTVSASTFVIKDGASLNNQGNLILQKNFLNACSNPTSIGQGTVLFQGNAPQLLCGQSLIQNLVIDNLSGVKLEGNTNVLGTLTLENGLLSLEEYNLHLGPEAIISGSPTSQKMIVAMGNGHVQKQFPLNFTGSFTFPVGDNFETVEYSPLILHYKSGTFTTDNFVGVNLRNIKYPDPSNTDNYLNRYWNISTNGASDLLYDLQFQYVSEDVVGEESSIKCVKYYEGQSVVYGQADSENNILNAESSNFAGSFTGGGGTGTFATLSGPSSVCHNSPGNTYNTETGKSNYIWNVSSGGIITAGGTTSDNFIVITWVTLAPQTLSVNYSGSSSPAVMNITVNPRPVPVISGPSTVCENSTQIVYSTETGMTNYQWSISQGGAIMAGQGSPQITVAWNIPGNQTVTVSYNNVAGCSPVTGTVYPVTVKAIVDVDVSVTPNNNNICAGTEVTFTANPLNGGTNPSYQWLKNSLPVGTNSPVYLCVPVNGDNIKVVLTSSEMCNTGPVTSDPVTMIVNPILQVTVTVQPTATQVCEGTQVTFNATPVNGGTNPAYTWFRNSTQVGSNSPVYSCVPNNGDIIHVVLTSSEVCQTGPASSDPVSIVVHTLPVPTITGLDEVCAGVEGIIYKTEEEMSGYSWAISSGGIITSGLGTSTVHVNWLTAGDHEVTVNYINSNNCTSPVPAIQVVHVNELPSPVIAGEIHVCGGASDVVYSTDPGMINYQWIISPGGIITSGFETNEVTVNWNSPGTNYIKVNYTNLSGCTALLPTNKTVFVHVIPEPTLSGPANSCMGTIETYSTEPGMFNYDWIISPDGLLVNGSGTDNIINVKWMKPGPQYIGVNYQNAYGCSAEFPVYKDISVTGPSITGPTEVCKLDTGVYWTQPGMGNTYIWTYKGGVKKGGGGPQDNFIKILWTAIGNRYVSVQYNDNGCIATGTLPVVVNNSSPSLVGPSTSCFNSVSTYTTECNMLNYLWNVSAGGEIIGESDSCVVTIQWHSTGSQWVSVDYDSPYGCSITPTTVNTYVYDIPVPKISGPTGPMCLTDDIMTYMTDANQLSYFWNCSPGGTIVAGGGSNQNYISIKWTQPGQQFVKVNYTTKHYCMASQPTQLNVLVNPLPTPTIGGPDLILVNTVGLYQSETGMFNYYWEVQSGGNIVNGGGSEDAFAFIEWYEIGLHTIALTYTDLNGCSGTTTYDVFVAYNIKSSGMDPTGNNNPENDQTTFNVYPVPNNGRFTVSIDSPTMDSYSIQIFNGLGAEIYVQQNIMVDGNYKQFIDISHVAEGVYSVILSNGQKQSSKRIHIRK